MQVSKLLKYLPESQNKRYPNLCGGGLAEATRTERVRRYLNENVPKMMFCVRLQTNTWGSNG